MWSIYWILHELSSSYFFKFDRSLSSCLSFSSEPDERITDASRSTLLAVMLSLFDLDLLASYSLSMLAILSSSSFSCLSKSSKKLVGTNYLLA